MKIQNSIIKIFEWNTEREEYLRTKEGLNERKKIKRGFKCYKERPSLLGSPWNGKTLVFKTLIEKSVCHYRGNIEYSFFLIDSFKCKSFQTEERALFFFSFPQRRCTILGPLKSGYFLLLRFTKVHSIPFHCNNYSLCSP